MDSFGAKHDQTQTNTSIHARDMRLGFGGVHKCATVNQASKQAMKHGQLPQTLLYIAAAKYFDQFGSKHCAEVLHTAAAFRISVSMEAFQMGKKGSQTKEERSVEVSTEHVENH